MPRQELVIKRLFKDFKPEELEFTDFYFEVPSDRFIEADEAQTARYWELKRKIFKEMTGRELDDLEDNS